MAAEVFAAQAAAEPVGKPKDVSVDVFLWQLGNPKKKQKNGFLVVFIAMLEGFVVFVGLEMAFKGFC